MDQAERTPLGAGGESRQSGSATSVQDKVTVPWLDGRLMTYLHEGPVLDIKAPGASDIGPIVPGAIVYTGDPEDRSSLDALPLSGSFAAIFAQYTLAFCKDLPATLALWVERLRLDGYLIVTMHAPVSRATHILADDNDTNAAIEMLMAPPSVRPVAASLAVCNAVSPITASALTAHLEAALAAGSFKIVHSSIAAARRSLANTDETARDIRLVVQKIALPDLHHLSTPESLPTMRTGRAVADVTIPFTQVQHHPLKSPGLRYEDGLLIRDFAPAVSSVSSIIVLKLDHHGDFIIGLPALRQLRQAFPQSRIRLVCGGWNAAAARACGLFDDVRPCDYFPERASEWTGSPASQGWKLFAAATEGHFDLAIDLRVDDDTRALLGRIDARQRCGIGSKARFPLLDVALPDGSREPRIIPVSAHGHFSVMTEGSQVLEPDAFDSVMEQKTPSFHEAAFSAAARILLRSGLFALPKGDYCAEFQLSTRGFVPGPRGVGIDIEVRDDSGKHVAKKVFGRRSLAAISSHDATLRFSSVGSAASYEFLVKSDGRPIAGRIRFGGMRLRRLDANGARFSPSELHVGEKLSLLISLVVQRTLSLSPSGFNDAPSRPTGKSKNIAIVPFSNSTVRDWPIKQYARLIELLVSKEDCTVTLIGAPLQVEQAARLMEFITDDAVLRRVENLVGKTKWLDVPDILRASDLVICNNSGVAHQSAQIGANTLAIYSASHQPLEWGPRGDRSRAIMASVACSPCGFERIEDCVHDHLCMRLITPEAVLGQVRACLESR